MRLSANMKKNNDWNKISRGLSVVPLTLNTDYPLSVEIPFYFGHKKYRFTKNKYLLNIKTEYIKNIRSFLVNKFTDFRVCEVILAMI